MAYAPFVWQVALSSTLNVALVCFATHENACRQFKYLLYFGPVLIGESVLLYTYMNWGFFQSWLPAAAWTAVDALFTRNLQFVLNVMIGTRLVVLVAVLVQVALRLRDTNRS